MPANVIDSLVVELGLDTTKLSKQQREAIDAFKKAQEAARKSGQEIEERSAKAAEGLEKVAKAAFGIFAAFTAGKGIKDFIESMIDTNAELGRVAQNIDGNAKMLAQWRGAAQTVGGDAKATTASIANLVSQFQQFSVTGQSAVLPYFRALGVQITDAQGRMLPFNDVLMTLSERFSHMDRARANFFGQQMGIDQGLMNLLLLGPNALRQRLADQAKYAPTPQDIAAAQRMQEEMAKLQTASTRLGVTLLTAAAPALDRLATFLNRIADWLQAHPTVLDAIAIGLGLIGTAITVGLSASAFAVAISGLGALTGAITTLSYTLLFTPFGWVVLGISAIVLAITHWRDVLKEVHSLWEDLTTKKGADARRKSYEDQHRKIWERQHGNVAAWHDAKAVTPASSGLSPRAQALMTTIGASESGQAYNVEYGGSKFSSYADHPNTPHLITSGPNRGKYSTAAGRYQMTYGTWKEAQNSLGLKDFSPASQDKAAWWLAQKDYRARTGRDLNADLASNDPNVLGNIGRVLSKTWTSLPGGIESSQSFSQFSGALGGGGGTTNSKNISIGTINVDANNAKDAAETWQSVGGAIDNFKLATQANFGPA